MTNKGVSMELVALLALTVAATAEQPVLVSEALGKTAPKYPVVGADGYYDDDGVYTLEGWGHGYYWGWDRGPFAYTEVAGPGDFTFTARVQAAPRGCAIGQVGISVREGLVGNEKTISLRYDEHHGELTWFYRFSPGDGTGEFCAGGDRYDCFKEGTSEGQFTQSEGYYLRLTRTQFRYTLHASNDGTEWTQIAPTTIMVLSPIQVYVGAIGVCGADIGATKSSCRFDKIDLSADATHAPSGTGRSRRACCADRVRVVRIGGVLELHSRSLSQEVQSVDLYSLDGRLVWMWSTVNRSDRGLMLSLPPRLGKGIYRLVATTRQGGATSWAGPLVLQ